MCWGVLDAFYIFDRVAECIHINLWRFCRRTASAGATAAATFGVAAAVLLLIFNVEQGGARPAMVVPTQDGNIALETGATGVRQLQPQAPDATDAPKM